MNITKRFISFILVVAYLVFGVAGMSQAVTNATEEELLKGRTESYNGVVEIEGETFVLFAQNSPEYNDIKIGSKKKSTIGQSACASCSLANILVNVLPYEDLPLLRNIAGFPIRVDTRSVTREQGIVERLSFEIQRNEDYFRYLPLCILNIVTGNNKGLGDRHNTASYYRAFFKNLGIEYATTKTVSEALEAVEKDHAVVGICVGGEENIIANIYGHYLTIAKVTEDRVYFLDSKFTDSYPNDKKGVIHVQQPGVFWVEREKIAKVGIHGMLYIAYPKPGNTHYTQSGYDEIITSSNILDKENKILIASLGNK